MDNLLWTNSGDSHFIEPRDLFKENLPAALADRLPRSEKVSDCGRDRAHRRPVVPPAAAATAQAVDRAGDDGVPGGDAAGRRRRVEGRGPARASRRPRACGARSCTRRSGCGTARSTTRDLVPEAAKVLNDHVHDELIRTSPRFVPDGHAAVAVGGAVDQGSAALRRPRLPRHLPAHRARQGRSVLERRPLGAAVGGDRGSGARDRRAHRHRRRGHTGRTGTRAARC